MCGICYWLVLRFNDDPYKSNDLHEALKRRGPDSQGRVVLTPSRRCCMEFLAGVLHLRGAHCTAQPIQNDHENTFLWNGEVFDGFAVDKDENDTKIIFETLNKCSNDDEILSAIAQIRGPWAFVFWQANVQKLWFGRDYFGRRSLLWHVSSNDESQFQFGLSSVADSIHNWNEVPASGVYCLSVAQTIKDQQLSLVAYCWHQEPDVPPPYCKSFLLDAIGEAQFMSAKIDNNERLKPPIRRLNREMPVELSPDETSAEKFASLLKDSVRKRTDNIALGKDLKPKLGVLFSGGIDSMVIAALAHKTFPEGEPIDLLNVAFEQKVPADRYAVPDRKTGLAGFEELSAAFPTRKWNFVQIDVTRAELQEMRETRIRRLVYPLCTVLDDSIGCALWFASRGTGKITNGSDGLCPYQSSAKVLLAGMGADEQLAGYSRHRNAFEQGSWKSLVDEIENDVCRISFRNLGRDDRCISDHGKEARFPFLDEEVVDYLHSLPMWFKADLRLPRGHGEKRLLRNVATLLGLPGCSRLPKRAIQFGTRIAKLEGGQSEKGSDTCTRLKSV